MTADEPLSLEVARIERAMRELLEAIEFDATRNRQTPDELEWNIYERARSETESDAVKIKRRPVAIVCRIGLRILGEHLMSAVADIEAMVDIAERAAAGPHKFERMIIILNTWKPIIEAAEKRAPVRAYG